MLIHEGDTIQKHDIDDESRELNRITIYGKF